MGERIIIRKATEIDFPVITQIFAHARQFMTEHGNYRQWAMGNWPPEHLLHQDIENENLFVCTVNDKVEGVFLYIKGTDCEPTYKVIEGSFKTDSEYGVIHRIASSGNVKGIGEAVFGWALQQCPNLRIDTHSDNIVMQKLLKKLGFRYCGIIHVTEDNDPRLAFEITRSDFLSQ